MNRVQSTISVRHISIPVEKPFSETCSGFESCMGRFDDAAFARMVREGASEMALRDYIKRAEGPFGLMIFYVIDHGALLRLAGKTARAKQYIVGNPLFALNMTEKDTRAGLYVPLRIYIREDGADKSVIEYDLPSTLLGQFQNAEVDRIAMMLDQKLEAAIDNKPES
jgi:uncharacterized protein (DUF302 family)